MTDKTYPLCKALGIKLHSYEYMIDRDNSCLGYRIDARDLERLLENLPVVEGVEDEECGVVSWSLPDFSPKHVKPTHRALVIAIEPIKRESAEDLLREAVDYFEAHCPPGTLKLKQRAKAFLEREKEREG